MIFSNVMTFLQISASYFQCTQTDSSERDEKVKEKLVLFEQRKAHYLLSIYFKSLNIKLFGSCLRLSLR